MLITPTQHKTLIAGETQNHHTIVQVFQQPGTVDIFRHDRSCRTLRAALADRFGVRIGIIMNDSVGRAWRLGTVGLAIGVAGPEPLVDLRGRRDLDGRELVVSETAFADEVAAAASIVMGQADEATPVVVAGGLDWRESEAGADALLRPHDEDLFR